MNILPWKATFCALLLPILIQTSLFGQAAGESPATTDRQSAAARTGFGAKKALPETHEERRIKRLKKVINEQGNIQFRYIRELHSMGRLKRSLEVVNEFLILYQDHALVFDACNEKAEILLKIGETRRAVDYYIRAFRRAHNEERGALAYLKAGKLLAEIGEVKRSRAIFKELLGWKPSSRISKLADIEIKSLRFLDGGGMEADYERNREFSPEKENSGEVAPEASKKKNTELSKKVSRSKGAVERKIGEGIGE